MRVPDFGRVDAFPGGLDEFVPCEVRRQAREAGIPESLLGPETPEREGRGAGDASAGGMEETAAAQLRNDYAGQFLM